jgi:phenylacetate-CoA ligase
VSSPNAARADGGDAMEYWSFPPRYDADYLPSSGSRYWFPKRETMPAPDRDQAILERLKEVTRYAWERAPFYRRKWEESGFHPDQLRSLEDFEEKVPVITKKDLRESQARSPRFGDYLCIADGEVHHIHGTSGTTGRPTVFAIGRGDWNAIANAHARIMWGMGVRPGDMVLIAAIFSLYMGSWGTLAGVERLRAKAFPFGAGAPGMTSRAAMWLDLMQPAAFYATPSFALHLAEVARSERLEPRNFGLKTMLFSGEPGASVPGVRDKIVAAYGANVIDCGSMAEMTPFMNIAGTAETDGMLLWQDIVYTEVCDPNTFRRVPYGERGTPVYTHLERTSQPMIRLVSGDLTLWDNGPTPCGRTYPRLPQGVFGRIDDMFTIRGENVYPSEVDAIMNQLAGYGGEHRIVITREGAMDELLVRVEAAANIHAQGDAALSALRDDASHRLQKTLGLRAGVEVVAPGTFPRTDFKARRVIDDREVFRATSVRLAGPREP